MPTRAVTVMGLIQVLALCVCYLLASAYLKSWEKQYAGTYPDWLRTEPEYKWLAFVHGYIFVLLLIPVAMGVACGRLTRTHRDIAMLGQDGFWLAVTLTVVTIVFAAYTIAVATGGAPYRRIRD